MTELHVKYAPVWIARQCVKSSPGNQLRYWTQNLQLKTLNSFRLLLLGPIKTINFDPPLSVGQLVYFKPDPVLENSVQTIETKRVKVISYFI